MSSPDTPDTPVCDGEGQKLSKNALKRLEKGKTKKKKETKDAAVAKGEPTAKKEKKPKKEKVPEEVFVDNTPAGDKKILDGPFPSSYQPQYVEAAWQAWWEKCGYYSATASDALGKSDDEKFVMVIPPPNVTGSLHLGHALTSAIEDTIVRWNRMKGKVTLWVPGIDHAGIATQSVVEKRLKKEENLSRHDIGREEFTKRVWEWKNAYGTRITEQQRMMGISADWTREAFTMDDNLSRAVTEAFVTFHEQGLIYRDTRLVNWSCALKSAISEIEVDYIDVEKPTFLRVPNHTKRDKYEFGVITSFAYKVLGEDGTPSGDEIVVATTRLETMLGDTAVAVHPEDPRYTHLHGKYLQHPFVDRKIPIITDATLVDMSFGTGAVKITPAHDPNDNMSGKRNNLDMIIMLTEDGRIASNGGMFAGMMRYDARVAMEEELKRLDLYRGKEPNKMRLGICSRSGDIIEPMMTPQWYVNCNSMAEKAIAAVRGGDLKLVPDFHEAIWYRWLENIRDWCVSRQLWWGHRIPAYFATVEGEDLDKNDPANSSRWVVSRTPDGALEKAAEMLNVPQESVVLTQDEDVLDTWFSSGLFPFSVFGWPNETEDFKAFYPTTLLETGGDILFFWVARMVMMGLQLTGVLPFKTVYLHAMVRDKMGRKMSKSLGNVIDPQEVIAGCTLDHLIMKIQSGNLSEKEVKKAIEAQKLDFPTGIPECGTDALRFGLLAYTVQGRDVNLDIKRVVGYRQFCNKVWNAVRFAVTYLNEFTPTPDMHRNIVNNPAVARRDAFVLSKLNRTIRQCNENMGLYQFAAVTTALHSFFLYDLCDVYLELIKPIVGAHQTAESELSSEELRQREESKLLAQATLYTCLEQFLRLAHPIMPFVTEELWQRLPMRTSMNTTPSIMLTAYPEEVPEWSNDNVEQYMSMVNDTIHAARSLRSDYKVPNHVQATFFIQTTSDEVADVLSVQADDFCTLAKGASLTRLRNDIPIPKGCCIKVINDQLSLLVDLSGLINVDDEIARLEKEVARLTTQVETYKKKMSAPDYEDKVPEHVRVLNTEKVQAYEAEMEKTMVALQTFQSMKN